MVLEEFTHPVVPGSILCLVLYFLYVAFLKKSNVPEGIPWLRWKPGVFANFRASIQGFLHNREIFEEGYHQYSAKGKTFMLANLMSGIEVVLPPSEVSWLLSQPDDILNAHIVQNEFVSSEYTILHPELRMVHTENDVVRRELTRQLAALTIDINDELSASFDDLWGKDTENWKEINVYETIGMIIGRTTNRVFVGLPLCRNETFIRNAGIMAQFLPVCGNLIRFLPGPLKPLFGPIIALPIRWFYWKCKPFIFPLVKKRLAERESFLRDPKENKSYRENNDFLQWLINTTETNPRPEINLSPDILSLRILQINFVAVHTSTFASSHTILDLASSPLEKEYLSAIRQESESVLAGEGGVWTKAAISKMYRTDSAIRESQRMNGLVTNGLIRKVVAPDGVVLPNGTHVAQGYRISTAGWSMHHDTTLHEDANTFDALRFSAPRERFEASADETRDRTEILKHKNMSMVTTSQQHLAFSHGKHACPGRFFAANELKLLIAYMAMHYDIEPLKERPANTGFSDIILPPTSATIRVKRRKIGT